MTSVKISPNTWNDSMMGSYHFQLLVIFVSKVPARTCHTPQWRASHPPAGLQRHHNHLGFQALTVRKRSEYDSRCGSDTWYLQSFIYIYIYIHIVTTERSQDNHQAHPLGWFSLFQLDKSSRHAYQHLRCPKSGLCYNPPFWVKWVLTCYNLKLIPEKLHDWKTMLSFFGCPS